MLTQLSLAGNTKLKTDSKIHMQNSYNTLAKYN
jgi:hypothetical protein